MSHGRLSDFVVAPSSTFYQGKFGRICPKLPPWHPPQVPPAASEADLEAHFLAFANQHMADHPGLRPHQISDQENASGRADDSANSAIPAGYTYFGQFIDHDITLDTTPLSESEVDPNKLQNFRTPRLDLDCVYGSGPDDQPYLYERTSDGMTGRMVFAERAIRGSNGRTFLDLPRASGAAGRRAIIGDMRNDENAIVAQIQLAFILAHNRLVDAALAIDPGLSGREAFERARRTLIWLYQWIVWHDFVRRVVIDELHDCALHKSTYCGTGTRWELGLPQVYSWKRQPFMPVEFSVAAYRFGHSMARNSYQTNSSSQAGFARFFPLFNVHRPRREDLSGFRRLQLRTVVQWDWFLDMASSGGPFPQRAHRIDTKLSNALAALRENQTANHFDNVLAARNLVRGVRMRLPSGTSVARKFGLQPVPIDTDVEPDALWYYVLKEAETDQGGERLGTVGSMIVAATFAGLLQGDRMSWICMQPTWTPDQDDLLGAVIDGHPGPSGDRPANNLKQDAGRSDNPTWSLASIIRLSGLPIDGSAFAGI